MITLLSTTVNPAGTINPAQDDNWSAQPTLGGIVMQRAKRNGRNPSTGEKRSRKYGLSMVYETGYPALSNTESNPIY